MESGDEKGEKNLKLKEYSEPKENSARGRVQSYRRILQEREFRAAGELGAKKLKRLLKQPSLQKRQLTRG